MANNEMSESNVNCFVDQLQHLPSPALPFIIPLPLNDGWTFAIVIRKKKITCIFFFSVVVIGK